MEMERRHEQHIFYQAAHTAFHEIVERTLEQNFAEMNRPRDVGVQTDRPMNVHIRSVGVNVTPEDLARISLRSRRSPEANENLEDFEVDTEEESEPKSDTEYWRDSSDKESNDEEDNFKESRREATRILHKRYPKLYLGIPDHSLYILKLLSDDIKQTRCRELTKEDIVMIILRRIKLAESFKILSNDFGICQSVAVNVFHTFLPQIASNLRQLIVWPSSNAIKRLLPISFMSNFYEVESIIDCFEIQIQKPTDPVWQALTWSEYKGCNTLKYLISITPNGLINFISDGFSGRISDIEITIQSGYLDHLRRGSHVMADRGFKQIENLIQEKGCILIRPATVCDGVRSQREEVLLSKRVASLRIHVERAIRRIREFAFLSPHSCIEVRTVPMVDYAVQVACGLINMQSSLIN